ncbi:MAG: hypothetical protein ACYDBV_01715 [Nitrospiria bacterium]
MKFNPITLLMAGMSLVLFFGKTPSSVAYEGVTVDNGGELYGTVKFKGEFPVNPIHKVLHNPEYCGESVEDQTFLINSENKGLQNVVLTIEDIDRGKKHDPVTVILENFKCHFVPHILAGEVGDSYEIKNSDPVLHNTHLRFEGATIFNVAMPPNGKNIIKPLTKAGVINAKCDAHTFMTGAIVVAKNPYFSVTDKNGAYKITDIPPGHYKLKIWHEGLAVKDKEISIKPNEKVNLSMEVGLK